MGLREPRGVPGYPSNLLISVEKGKKLRGEVAAIFHVSVLLLNSPVVRDRRRSSERQNKRLALARKAIIDILLLQC